MITLKSMQNYYYSQWLDLGMMEDESDTWKHITYSGVKTMIYLGIHIYTCMIKW